MKDNFNEISAIAHHVKANLLTYGKLPAEEFEEHVSSIIKRFKMQKELFIKEIANAIDHKAADLVPDNDEDMNKSNLSALEKFGDSISKHDEEACISLLVKIEQNLYDRYSSFLFEKSPDEITRMILTNQSNEIKRDIRILNNLYEYA
jgi:hypothetical protein